MRRWVAHGLMPAPIRLGLRTVVWDAEEIEQWQTAQAASPRGQWD
nr:AlpA family phage regulatory protein [Thiocystis violascens]